MNPIQLIAITAIYLGFALVEIISGRFSKLGASKDDWKIDSVMLFLLLTLIQPGIVVAVNYLGMHFFPLQHNAYSYLPAWIMFAILLVADDLTQYWWHRLSHTSWMWPFHRAHHSAAYMSIRVVYRNNFFYYAHSPEARPGRVLAVSRGRSKACAAHAEGDGTAAASEREENRRGDRGRSGPAGYEAEHAARDLR